MFRDHCQYFHSDIARKGSFRMRWSFLRCTCRCHRRRKLTARWPMRIIRRGMQCSRLGWSGLGSTRWGTARNWRTQKRESSLSSNFLQCRSGCRYCSCMLSLNSGFGTIRWGNCRSSWHLRSPRTPLFRTTCSCTLSLDSGFGIVHRSNSCSL